VNAMVKGEKYDYLFKGVWRPALCEAPLST